MPRFKVVRTTEQEIEAPDENEARCRAAEGDDCDYSDMGFGQVIVTQI